MAGSRMVPHAALPHLGWLGIVRLGLVQTSLGAIVVLTTSTINRVMVVELALPAMVPGALVALHYAVQILRPRWGHASDQGGRLTPWIIGGMAMLALGGLLAAIAAALVPVSLLLGLGLSVFAFVLIGIGVGASGTSLLVLLSKRVDDARRPAAATVVWVMMIMGFIVTAATAGHYLDPFTLGRLVLVSGIVSAIALCVTCVAVWGVEQKAGPAEQEKPAGGSFRAALTEVWSEPQARLFAIFVFVSMIAYSAQDLILEPFAGSALGFTPGQSTSLAGIQHGGVLVGMVMVALLTTVLTGRTVRSMRIWAVGGCLASALALIGLVFAAQVGPSWPFKANVFILGVSNGAYAVAAIGSMMRLVGEGHAAREGVRMGLWGAAQGVAFGIGGFLGTAAVDIAGRFLAAPADRYGAVFAAEALLFVVSAVLAVKVARLSASESSDSSRARQPVAILAVQPDFPAFGHQGGQPA